MLREQVPSPGEGEGGGFVPGEKQGEHLVPELPVTHRYVRLVPETQQHGEEVARVLSALAPLVDEAVDHLVQSPDTLAETEVGGRWEVAQEEPRHHGASLLLELVR